MNVDLRRGKSSLGFSSEGQAFQAKKVEGLPSCLVYSSAAVANLSDLSLPCTHCRLNLHYFPWLFLPGCHISSWQGNADDALKGSCLMYLYSYLLVPFVFPYSPLSALPPLTSSAWLPRQQPAGPP